jgi:hypothetical protein
MSPNSCWVKMQKGFLQFTVLALGGGSAIGDRVRVNLVVAKRQKREHCLKRRAKE